MRVILGAGLSGLSLAVALVRAGVRDDVVLVDRRTEFGRDRTWCTWEDARLPFRRLARRRWSAWEIVTARGEATGRSRRHPYVLLDSRDVYAAALEELAAAPNVTLRLGERVLAVGDGWARTEHERWEGWIYDGLALASPALRSRRPGHTELTQGFLGWEVETERPMFTPERATLMDFRVPQPPGLHFLYVLPFAPHRALVEHTSLGREMPTPASRRAVLREHLRGAGAIRVHHEERGRIPMSTAELPVVRSPRTFAIGTAGGAVRPSSGYAFTRIQRMSHALARSARTGDPYRPPPGAGRRSTLDALMLRALARDPARFPERFRRLVARTDGDTFARFMTDADTFADDLRVVAALGDPRLLGF